MDAKTAETLGFVAQIAGEGVDPVAAQVIVADVRDQRGISGRDGEAEPEDASARRLEHREVDVRAAQHDPRGGGPGPVAAVQDLGADRYTQGPVFDHDLPTPSRLAMPSSRIPCSSS